MPFVHPYRTVGELSEVERWKLARHPLEVADAVIAKYSVEGPGAIAKVAGEAERLKWVGLYPQRQGGDAFMLRIKVPGGHMTAPQVREIGVVADAFAEGPQDSPVFGNRYADLTTRQDIQLHWIRIEDVPRIWQRLWDVGITTVQACGDSARNVTACPVAGVDADEVFDAYPVAREISEFFTGNREYANLPRKFKIAVTGCLEDCARVEINDIGLWPARTAGGDVGFNVLVGGGLSDGRADGLRHRRVRRPRPGGRAAPAPSPNSSASSAIARTGARRACATWSKSSGPRAFGPPWPTGSASSWRRPATTSPGGSAATTWACTPSASRGCSMWAAPCPSAACGASSWWSWAGWPRPTATAPCGSGPTRTSS